MDVYISRSKKHKKENFKNDKQKFNFQKKT